MSVMGKSSLWVGVFVLMAFFANDLYAAEIYKYRDDNGRWVYTDKKPKHQNYEMQKRLVTEVGHKVTVVNRGSSERPRLYAVNEMHGPAQVWLQMNRSDNVGFFPPAPSQWLVPGPGEMFLGYIAPLSEDRPWAYEWLPRYIHGKPVEGELPAVVTVPPPCRDGRHPVTQGFGGEASHSSHTESWHAVDIYMPEGTPIYAVRDGVVMDVERNFTRSGWREEYADEANYIRVLHDDSTMAVYAHLSPEKMNVHLGQRVQEGQHIAFSGNTGYSTGPHLHFVMQYNAGKELKSLPFRFTGFDREPKVGDILR